ncbi:MAG TPA: FAD-linked oxidase C-terminal domain-containing protein [Verrucomicrobiae bacterium]|jgi:FAD/FMN-containing dehydrogenase/Fe-S oxidoreductase|nr:FAD-linked oxidase C-terminal domain-containing protein [Verrucomicrobiae bacterium]
MNTTKPPPEHVRNEPGNHWHGDVEALAKTLKRTISGEVRFDPGARALYSVDSSNYRQIPIGAVVPKTAEDVVHTISVCREFGAPILSRGGGTSLAGQCCNVAVVMDFSKYLHKILELNPLQKTARVEPGVVLDDLRAAAEKHHLTFGPDPSTHNHCTLGGMIGNNSCGVHSIMAGKTVENIIELEVVTYDGLRMRVGKTTDEEVSSMIAAGGRRGEIYEKLVKLRNKYADLIRKKYPKIPRRVSGYNLDQLLPEYGFNVAGALVGTEGTCVTVLQAVTRLVHSPPFRVIVALGYPDVYSAGDHVPEVLACKPIGLEGLDDVLARNMKKLKMHSADLKLLPEGNGWLIAEFGGETKEEAVEKAHHLMRKMKKFFGGGPSMKLYDDPELEKKIWEVREAGLGATARVPGEPVTWEGWEDSAVPPDKVGTYLRELRKLYNKFGYACSLYGHFGDGCIHTRIDFGLKTKSGIEKYRRFVEEAAVLVVGLGGSISGEHGDGQSKAELLPIMFGRDLVEAFEEFKKIWDPQNKMNPGKVVNAFHNNENLRLGPHYNPWQPQTKFFYGEDGGNFSDTMLRCVGVGKCRRGESGTMCPSYMVTREEMHSTRGRARMLFEMLQGEVIHDGWKSKEVLQSLDLCLACKGCQSDCPMHVDMATYKAEFLSHYYERRLRPRHAYSMGLIHVWAGIASKIPRLVNLVGAAPLSRNLVKWLGGISQKRSMPRFAKQTFRAWWNQRKDPGRKGPPVVLWVDTFNNYFHPEILQAAVQVLEATGHHVIVPRAKLCCGRPLYDFGMLDYAKKLLAEILISLRSEIRAEIPIIGLEPSCVSVFRDELKRLFPFDEDADRLANRVVTLSQFFSKYSDFRFPKLHRNALVHGHCHDKAVMKMEGATDFLKHLGLDFKIVDSGCCGMAGSFGFEAEHYEVSVRCGERMLLPTVRETDEKTILIADGFSCREQIEQLAHRRALHTAEVAAKALREGSYQNGEGHKIQEPHTIPEMQEQSELKNRTKAEPMEIGHEH